MPIDTSNKHRVSHCACDRIAITGLNGIANSMSPDDALNLAAWLVQIADGRGTLNFDAVRDAVKCTKDLPASQPGKISDRLKLDSGKLDTMRELQFELSFRVADAYVTLAQASEWLRIYKDSMNASGAERAALDYLWPIQLENARAVAAQMPLPRNERSQ
jgi:hypothetical protein